MNLKVEIRELSDYSCTLVVEGVKPYFINTLRRVMISKLPKMAIEDVEFHLGSVRDEDGKDYESVSPLFDEVLAHRLGLLPIPTDLERFNFKDQCKCGGEGCPSCTLMYVLNKKGPCTVYSGDLEPLAGEEFRIRDPLIPIVKLKEGQAPLIYATAVLGTGEMHSKWQAVCGIGYKYYPNVEIDQKKLKNPAKAAEACPQGILKVVKKKLQVTDIEKCTMCRMCEEEEPEAIRVWGDDSKFIFHFETDTSLDAKTALIYSLGIAEELFTDFKDSLTQIL